MSTEFWLSPLNVRVYKDDDFFNNPQSDLKCCHCAGPLDDAPKLVPFAHQDTKIGSKNARESKCITHDTLNGNKLACSFSCVKARLSHSSQSLFLTMLNKVYKIPYYLALEVNTALPIWTLSQYGGILTIEQHREWSKTRKIDGIIDCSDIKNNAKAYRMAINFFNKSNKYLSFSFDKKDSFWFKNQPLNTKLCCWNQCGTIMGIKPISAALEYNVDLEQATECSGFFCGLDCAVSYLIRLGGQFQRMRVLWMGLFYSKEFAYGRNIFVQCARSRKLLKIYGGPMELNEWRESDSKMRIVRSAPLGQDFPFYGSKNLQQFYVFQDEKMEFNIIQLMNSKMAKKNATLEMNGDEYGKNIECFVKKFHIVGVNVADDMRLHFAASCIKMDQDLKSNEEILKEMISNKNLEI